VLHGVEVTRLDAMNHGIELLGPSSAWRLRGSLRGKKKILDVVEHGVELDAADHGVDL
jgi:hypothetical protein